MLGDDREDDVEPVTQPMHRPSRRWFSFRMRFPLCRIAYRRWSPPGVLAMAAPLLAAAYHQVQEAEPIFLRRRGLELQPYAKGEQSLERDGAEGIIPQRMHQKQRDRDHAGTRLASSNLEIAEKST